LLITQEGTPTVWQAGDIVVVNTNRSILTAQRGGDITASGTLCDGTPLFWAGGMTPQRHMRLSSTIPIKSHEAIRELMGLMMEGAGLTTQWQSLPHILVCRIR
jgi:hypothetical protein